MQHLTKIFSILAVLSFTFSNAQAIQAGTNTFGFDNVLLVANSPELADVKGDPYYNSYPIESLLINEDNEKYRAFVKYNIFYDRIEFSEDQSFKSAKMLPTDEDLMIQMNTDLFKYAKVKTEDGKINGYFKVLAMNEGEPAILKRFSQNIQVPRQASTGSYGTAKDVKKLRSSSAIYFMDDGYGMRVENHKRKVLKSFPNEYQEKLEDFIKENNLKFKDDYRGLQEVVKEYYRLKEES